MIDQHMIRMITYISLSTSDSAAVIDHVSLRLVHFSRLQSPLESAGRPP